MSKEEEDSVDDFLEGLGLSTKDPTPMDGLMRLLTEGNYKKIFNLRYWLKHEMHGYDFLLKNNVLISKSVYDSNTDTMVNRPIQRIQYAKLMVRRYVFMHHFCWTDGTFSKEPFDMDKMVQMIVDYPEVKEALEKTP